MPVLMPVDTFDVATLFPDLPAGQRVRDIAVVPRGTAHELAALGRVFYQTAPRDLGSLGGGVRLGDTALFLPTLGYGERAYERQSATFGDPSRDRAVLYRFVQHAAHDSLTFVAYESWPFTASGQPVLGLAVGRLRGVDARVLFVLVGNAWGDGVAHDAPALFAFRILGSP